MEDRIAPGLYLEMTDQSPDAYDRERVPAVLRRPAARRATVWRNLVPGRDDLPRTIPEFATLAVYEVDRGFQPPPAAEGVRGHHFLHHQRPAQGTLSGKPTLGLSLVLVSPSTEEGAQALRDWADFIHIREIAAANVPGFRMITPYENAQGRKPRFLHFYEMDTPDAEEAFLRMAPLTVERLRPRGREAVREWMGHAELSIDYVNSFARVSETRA